MAYGVQVFNKFGEEVVDMTKPHLYAYQTGTTKTWLALHNESAAAISAAGLTLDTYIVDSGGFGDQVFSQAYTGGRTLVASPSGTYTNVLTSPALTMAHPTMNLIEGDLVFYDVATYGLLMSYNMVFYGFTDLTPTGGVGLLETEGMNNIGYTIMSTREPVASPATNYGMQLFDASGSRVFDSRQDIFTIFDHFYVDQSIFQRVIENGISIDLSLSESHTDFRVAAPNHTSFYSYEGGYRAQAMIKKVSSSTIRISHVNNGGAQTGTTRSLYQDTVIIIGR